MNPSYDGFRAAAFLAVFLAHTDHLSCGYLGVQGFFVLSGYLITPILVETKQQRTFAQYYSNFIVRRALRIFPLYYGYLLILALANGLGVLGEARIETPLQWLSAVTYSYNIYHATDSFQRTEFLTHFWSLAVEEQFYLGWPLLVYWASARRLRQLLVSLMVAGPFVRFALARLAESEMWPWLTSQADVLVYVSTLSHLDAFATGAFFALFFRRHVSDIGVVAWFAALIVLGLALNLAVGGALHPSSLGYPMFMKGAYRHVWGYSAFNIAFGLVLFRMKKRDFFASVFESAPVTYLGRISYGLYVYHFGAIALIERAFSTDPWKTLTSLVATVIVAALSFGLFEERLIRLKDRLAPKAPLRQSGSSGA